MLFLTFLNCMYYVSYRVSYRDNCIEIRIVSWENVSFEAYLSYLEKEVSA